MWKITSIFMLFGINQLLSSEGGFCMAEINRVEGVIITLTVTTVMVIYLLTVVDVFTSDFINLNSSTKLEQPFLLFYSSNVFFLIRLNRT